MDSLTSYRKELQEFIYDDEELAGLRRLQEKAHREGRSCAELGYGRGGLHGEYCPFCDGGGPDQEVSHGQADV